jgi:hypothetical protein
MKTQTRDGASASQPGAIQPGAIQPGAALRSNRGERMHATRHLAPEPRHETCHRLATQASLAEMYFTASPTD